MAYEWVMTEAIALRALKPATEMSEAVIMADDHSKAVVVRYAGDTSKMYFNEELYDIGENPTECLVTWMHSAAVEFGLEEMALKAHDWDPDLAPLNFVKCEL